MGLAIVGKNVDASVRAIGALRPVVVLGTRHTVGVVLDGDGLVVGEERSAAEVGVTTSPLDGSIGSILATCNPGTKFDLHGSLGESSTILGIGIVQGADQATIDVPFDVVLGPVNGISVELLLRVADGVVGSTVVGGSITLAEVVGLDLGCVTTEPLPVNLVEIVGLQNEAGNNTLTGASTNSNVDLAEEDPLGALDGGSIRLLVDGENSTVGTVEVDGSTGKLLEKIVLALGKVNIACGAESWIIGASLYELV